MDEQTQFQLNEYLDGTLAETERREVETLLAQSAEAREFLARLQATFDALDGLDEVAVEQDFGTAVLHQITPSPSSRWANGWLLAQLIGVVILAILAWPTLQMWLNFMSMSLSLSSEVVSLTAVSTLWQEFWAGVTAVSFPNLILPTFGLEGAQLFALALVVGVAWLLTNGFLLRQQSE